MLNTSKQRNQFESAIEQAVRILKGNTMSIQGRNPKIEYYYNVWKGKPEWLKYNIHLPDGSIKEDYYKTINAQRYICRSWANNYMNEDTDISISNENANKRLQEIFETNGFKGKLNNFVESFMGLGIGGMVVNPSAMNKFTNEDGSTYVQAAEDADVKIQFVGGRRVYPITVEDGEFKECAFISFKTNGAKCVIHWKDEQGYYKITELEAEGTNGAYSFENGLKKEILEANTLDTKSMIPLFVIWNPNVTDEDDVENVVGTSVFDKAMDSFWQCDLIYTALFKEIKLGQKVKMISQDLTITTEDGDKATSYDPNDESIIELPSGTDTQAVMQEFNGDLRVPALTQALEFNLNIAAMLSGLGQGYFEFQGGGRPLQTATAVIAKQSELYKNIMKQENFATMKFKQLLLAIAYVNDNFTGKEKIGTIDLTKVNIKYDDNILQDSETAKKNDSQDVSMGIMTPEEYRSNWTEETKEQALKSMQETGQLASFYLPALQAGAMSPEFYCNRVYGNTDQLEYIKSKFESQQVEDPFAMEQPTKEKETSETPSKHKEKEEVMNDETEV